MASIKRSELEKLQADSAELCLIQEDSKTWLARWITAAAIALTLEKSIEEWKVRTWTAEQEIHDLKEQIERNDQLHDESVEWLQGNAGYWWGKWIEMEKRLCELQKRYTELLAQKVVHIADSVPGKEYVHEPKKVNWANISHVYGDLGKSWSSETYYAAGKATADNRASCETLESALFPVKKVNPLKHHFSRIAISLLLLTVLGLGLVTYRQSQIIQYQQHVLVEAAQYILQNCPPIQTDRAQQ